MRKTFQYILMAVALVATASCSNELDDTLQPVENGTLQFVVSDFPAFGEGVQTRAIGTQDEGKTEWVDGDQIFVTLTSQKYGEQAVELTYNGSSWSTEASLSYLENEKPIINVIYAPCYEVTEGSALQLRSGMQLGMTECFSVRYEIEDGILTITFEGTKRTYSRLRIAGPANQTLTVTTTGFTPAGPEGASAPESYILTTDDNGNAFLYGTFAESATVSVNKGDVTLKDYTFTAEKNPNGTEAGKSYALDARPSFSVSADKKVLFSPGNLQYTQSTNTWSFAENQYDVLGETNISNGNLADKIDLFGWSSDNPKTPFGVSTSEEDSDYSGNFVDWGTNEIDGYASGTWHTLSADEWMYLLHGRENAEKLFAFGIVNGVDGLIILPDNWETPSGLTFVASVDNGLAWDTEAEWYMTYNGSLYDLNAYTADEWEQMKAAGAVFLPLAGFRVGTGVYIKNSYGSYWSSTIQSATESYYVMFDGVCVSPKEWGAANYSTGNSVRLVRDL